MLTLFELVTQSKKVEEANKFQVLLYRKIHCLASEFHVKFHLKNWYRTNREAIRAIAIRAISVFQVKFNVEFTRQVENFSWIA